MGNCQSQESLTMVLNRNRLNQINNVLIPEIRQNIIQLQQLPQLETALSLEYENTRLIEIIVLICEHFRRDNSELKKITWRGYLP